MYILIVAEALADANNKAAELILDKLASWMLTSGTSETANPSSGTHSMTQQSKHKFKWDDLHRVHPRTKTFILHSAASQGFTDVCKIIVSQFMINLMLTDLEGNTCLHKALLTSFVLLMCHRRVCLGLLILYGCYWMQEPLNA